MRVIIFGAKGTLGGELARQLTDETVFALDSEDVDITDRAAVQAKIAEINPDVIFNCAASNALDKIEADPEEEKKAWVLNRDAVKYIAEVAAQHNAILVQYSTGYIFDGNNAAGYAEDAPPNPQSVYAKTKLAGEIEAQKIPKHYIIRLNLLFGAQGSSPKSKQSFPEIVQGLVAQGKTELDFVTDEISSPTYAKDLAAASIKLVKDNYPYGIYHLVNEGRASWLDYAQEIFKIKPMPVKLNGITTEQFIAKNAIIKRADRPHYSVLLNTKFPKLRTWQEALREFLQS